MKYYVYLLLFSIIIRFPYFFIDVIDWDESSFILIGQEILNGYLPYTNLWELKPPLTFYHYAFFILIFGKNILGIRLGGLILVYLSSLVIFRISRFYWSTKVAFLGSLFFIIICSSIQGGQATLSEHLTLIPQSLILCLLSSNYLDKTKILLIGLVLGSLILIRSNLIILTLPIFFLITYLSERKLNIILKNIGLLSIAFLLPFFLTCLCYYLDDNLTLFVKSYFIAPLNYVYYITNNLGFYENFFNWYSIIKSNVNNTNYIFWSLYLSGSIVLLTNRLNKKTKQFFIITLTLSLFVLFSILKTGREFGHYFIQLTPYCSLIGCVFLNYIGELKKPSYKVLIIICILLLIYIPSRTIASEYINLYTNYKHNGTFYRGTGFKIAEYLNRFDVKNKYVYFLTFHICHWFLDTKSPNIFIHPSDVAKDFIIKSIKGSDYSSEKLMIDIINKKPIFIIKYPYESFFAKFNNDKSRQILDDEIKFNYREINTIDDVLIYTRTN